MSAVLIIGAGPAGISAALYAVRSGLDVTVFTKGSGSLTKAEKIENYYGWAEPVSGRQLEQNGIDGAKRLGVKVIEDEILWLGQDDEGVQFLAKSQGHQYAADSVVLAAGAVRNAPNLPGLKEYEGHGVSYCAICDAFFYRGKTVSVLGASEYARHEAETLLPHAGKVQIFTDGREPAAEMPAAVDVYTEKLDAVDGDKKVTGIRLADGTIIPTDGVFVAYGAAGSTDLARKVGAAIEDGHIVVDETMSTNIPGLYAAGDCTGGLLQVAKAVYEGAQAGLAAVRYLRGHKA